MANATDSGASDDDRVYTAAIPLHVRENLAPRPAPFPKALILPRCAGTQIQSAVTSAILEVVKGPLDFHGTIIVCPTAARLPTRIDPLNGFRLEQHLLVNGRVITLEPGHDPSVRMGHVLAIQANGAIIRVYLDIECRSKSNKFDLPGQLLCEEEHDASQLGPFGGCLTDDGRIARLEHSGGMACLDFPVSQPLEAMADVPDWKVDVKQAISTEELDNMINRASERDEGKDSTVLFLHHSSPPVIPDWHSPPRFTDPTFANHLLKQVPFLLAARNDQELNGPTLGPVIYLNMARLNELTYGLRIDKRIGLAVTLTKITELMQRSKYSTYLYHTQWLKYIASVIATTADFNDPSFDPVSDPRALTIEKLSTILCDPYLFQTEIDLTKTWQNMSICPTPRSSTTTTDFSSPSANTFETYLASDVDGDYSTEDEMEDITETPFLPTMRDSPEPEDRPAPETTITTTLDYERNEYQENLPASPDPNPLDYYQEMVEEGERTLYQIQTLRLTDSAPSLLQGKALKKPNIIVDEETPEDTRVVIRTDQRHTGLKRVQIDVGKHVRVFVSIHSTDSPTKGSSDDIIDPTEIATDNDTTVDVLQVTAIPEIASPRPRPLTPYQLRHIHTLSLPPLPPGPIQLPTPVEDELESEKESDPESDSSDGEMDTDSDTSFWETSARSQPTNVTRGSETDSEEGQQPGDDMSKQPSSPLSLASDLPLIKDLIEPVPAPSLAAIQQAAFQLQHPQHPVTLIHAAGNHHEPPYLTFAIHTREPDNFGHVDAMTVHKRRHRMNVDAAGEVSTLR